MTTDKMNILQKVTPRGNPLLHKRLSSSKKVQQKKNIDQIFSEIVENKSFKTKKSVFKGSEFTKKFKENQDMKFLIEQLKTKYLSQPVFKLIMMDNKVDLDLKMNLLTSNFS